MTLYRHFGSKDELILEYLNYKGKKSDEIWAEIERASPGDPVGPALWLCRDRRRRFIVEDERGCDLANAAVELTEQGHPGLRVIEEFKSRQRERLADLCQAAGASQPGLLADTLVPSDRRRAGQPPQRRNGGPERQTAAAPAAPCSPRSACPNAKERRPTIFPHTAGSVAAAPGASAPSPTRV